jgi:hypothetical protein
MREVNVWLVNSPYNNVHFVAPTAEKAAQLFNRSHRRFRARLEKQGEDTSMLGITGVNLVAGGVKLYGGSY